VQNVVNWLVERGRVVVKVWLKPEQIVVVKHASFFRISNFLKTYLKLGKSHTPAGEVNRP
jgi:hypothetical protein